MVVLLQIFAAAIGFSQASLLHGFSSSPRGALLSARSLPGLSQASLMHGFSSSPRGALLSARSLPVLLSAASPTEGDGIAPARNVLGGELQCCCANVGGSGIGTGFYRDGHCSTGQQDEGRHTVCIEATEEFLKFSKAVGNDLSTPMQPHHLKASSFDQAEVGNQPRFLHRAARW